MIDQLVLSNYYQFLMRNMQDFYCETVTRFLLDFGVKFNFELIVFPYRNIFNFLFTPSHSPTA